MKYKLKPLNTIHIYIFLTFTLFAIPFDIVLIASPFDIGLFLTQLVYHALIVLCYLFARLFYNVTYVVDDKFLTQYKGKCIVFKIEISDIKAVFIKKAKWYDFFAYWADVLLSLCICTHGTSISFVFDSCEINEKINTEIPRQSIKPSYLYKKATERVEIFSHRKCANICKRLQITPEFV